MIQQLRADLYLKTDCLLAEGPVWHAGALYWTDIFGKAIYIKADVAMTATRYEVPFEVGSFALWKPNVLILATEFGFYSFDLVTRQLESLGNPEKSLPNNRFNDGKCDPRGRFVAGTLNRHRAPEAALYRLDYDFSIREVLRPLTCSNGLAWSEDGTTFFHIETATGLVRAFDYDLATGSLSRERIAVKIPSSHGRPDGMTIDRNGNLWIALWEGSAVECWDPRTGKRLARVEVPVPRVSSCTFGGAHYETLFITTAKPDEKTVGIGTELGGSIFQANPGVTGFPAVHLHNPDNK